jgi:hypothetical protein
MIPIATNRFATLLLAVWCVADAAAGEESAGDARKAWQYKVAAGERTIFAMGDQKWMVFTPKGPTFIYVETERTGQYIEMRSTEEENLFRLYTDHGEVKKSTDEPWSRFAAGRWLDDPNLYDFDKLGPLDDKLRLIYFVAKDRTPTANYETKIRVVMKFVASFFLQDLRAKGSQTDGLQFELDENQLPRVHLVTGEQNAAFYNDLGQFNTPAHHQRILKEIGARLTDNRRHVAVVFAETYDEGPADRVWPGHIAQAVALPPDGGNATFSAWMLRDEFCALTVADQMKLFFDATPIRGRTAIGHRGPNSPRFEFVEDAIGGLIHEVGHALGLPHDHRQPELFIMGNGFRNLRANVAASKSSGRKATFSDENALLLMCSRYLSAEVDRLDYKPPEVEFQLVPGRRGLTASLTAKDDQSLRAVVFIDENHKDRSLVLGKQLSGVSQTLEVQLPPSVLQTGTARIEAVVVDAGGNYTRVSRSTR